MYIAHALVIGIVALVVEASSGLWGSNEITILPIAEPTACAAVNSPAARTASSTAESASALCQ
jgi:hypothetical protein